jgi:transposase
MNNHTTIGVDLAKNVIAVARLSKTGKLSHNKELSRRKFRDYLATQKVSLVAFEACATAHYWSRAARSFGHDTKHYLSCLCSPFVKGIRLTLMMR